MGADKWEKEARKGSRSNGGETKPSKAKSGIITLHPTKADKDALAEGLYGPLEALDSLAEYMERGPASLSITYQVDRDVFSVVLREKAEVWNAGVAVSVFHVNPGKALAMLGWLVEKRHPDFPQLSGDSLNLEFDW